jgi:Flp pilus assembly protein TadD
MRNIPLHSKCALKSRPDFRIGTLLKAAALLIFLTLAFPSLLIAQIVSSEPAPEVIQHLKLGSEAMHQGNAAEAERQFQQAVTAAPQLADGYLGLGLAQLSQFRLDAAVASLTKATELNPQLSGVHMFLGIALYQQGNAESAIANFQQELAAQPKNVEALTWMGIVEISSISRIKQRMLSIKQLC